MSSRFDLPRIRSLFGRIAFTTATCLAIGACGEPADVTTGEDEELVSKTALTRDLAFEGMVYVAAGASDATILKAARLQTKSAFGPLRLAFIATETRELSEVDAKNFVKENVQVLDPATGKSSTALRVRYKYTDKAIVPTTMARRSSVTLGLLSGNYDAQAQRIIKECTPNTKDDQESASIIWYVFNPALDSCKTAMKAEQAAIDAARTKLPLPKAQVVPAELSRLYVPMTARLTPSKTTTGAVYPEYHRLWAGGIEKDKVVFALVNGEIDHPEAGKPHHVIDDSGYLEMMSQMDVILKGRPNLKIVATEPAVDMASFTVNGKLAKGVGFKEFVNWELNGTGFPAEFSSSADRLALRKAVGERLMKRWVILEETVTVKIGTAAARKVTIKIKQFFGADEGDAPHKKAVKTADVILYNGHSYIGSGPWDPSRYSMADFPASYQILFIDGCISYNYYNKDFFLLKKRGATDLDTITNGMESFADGSGAALGRFVLAMVGGKQPSYMSLLTTAGTTGTDYDWGKDALRVVDGEIGNVYTPTTVIAVTAP